LGPGNVSQPGTAKLGQAQPRHFCRIKDAYRRGFRFTDRLVFQDTREPTKVVGNGYWWTSGSIGAVAAAAGAARQLHIAQMR
jgi:hypothetical protein